MLLHLLNIFSIKKNYKDGWLQIDRGNVVAINGLDGIVYPTLDRFQYARKEIPTTSFFQNKIENYG
jgi:hypothetical protein